MLPGEVTNTPGVAHPAETMLPPVPLRGGIRLAKKRALLMSLAMFCLLTRGTTAPAAYGPTNHRSPGPGEIPVTGAGACDQAGKTYVLTRDVSSEMSALFVGKDITLDLNGYTVWYAAGRYEHVPNYGFEEGLAHWDVSMAPSAKTEDTDKVKPFIGKKILRLSKGEEIVSEYITLPVANRSYYAMCGVLTNEMKVTVGVDDERGRPVICDLSYGDEKRRTCPQTGNTMLGGGFVFAYLRDLPAGKYRIRVHADTDCLLDEVDIRPALDAGIGIVGPVQPWGSYDSLLLWSPVGFPDYAKTPGGTEPASWIPRVTGPCTITIRNGVIRNGFEGIRSWGVFSSTDEVRVVLDNVRVVTSGISAGALRVPRATIRNCRFENDAPFIIQRHDGSDCSVSLTSADGSEVSNSTFIGGQGNLSVSCKGNVTIHDNLFVNRETVVNHYSLGLGSGAEIYRNVFRPEIGSGILTGGQNNDIHDNSFEIVAANGCCEYTDHTEYTTSAIRLTDYDRPAGTGCFNNRVHHNRMKVVGRSYPNYPDYRPIAAGVRVDCGGGVNYVYDNDITVELRDLNTTAQAAAFYVSLSNGGEYRHNRVTTNVPAFWIGNPYGPAKNAKVIENTIIRAGHAPADFKPFRLGWWQYGAVGIEFIGNRFVNCEFGVQAQEGVEIRYTNR